MSLYIEKDDESFDITIESCTNFEDVDKVKIILCGNNETKQAIVYEEELVDLLKDKYFNPLSEPFIEITGNTIPNPSYTGKDIKGEIQ